MLALSDFFLGWKNSTLTPIQKCPILAPSRLNPRGWVRIGNFHNDGISADREAFAREQGCERVASDTLKSAQPTVHAVA